MVKKTAEVVGRTTSFEIQTEQNGERVWVTRYERGAPQQLDCYGMEDFRLLAELIEDFMKEVDK